MAKPKQLMNTQNLDSKPSNQKTTFLRLVCNILQLCFVYEKDFHPLYVFNNTLNS